MAAWQTRLNKRRKQGETVWGNQMRGPNTGAWEKLYINWDPGFNAKRTRQWNSGYNGPGKGTW